MASRTSGEVSPEQGVHSSIEDTDERETKRLRLLYPSVNAELPKLLSKVSSDNKYDVQVALSRLCQVFGNELEEDGTTATFFHRGGHVLIVDAMKKHRNCCIIQHNACGVILRLALDRKVDIEDIGGLKGINLSFGSLGALDNLKQAVERFPNDNCLNTSAIIAFHNLLIPYHNNLPLFLDLENIYGFMIAMMRRFPDDACVQQLGSRIMTSVLLRGGNRKVLKEAGVLSVIVAVMERFSDDSDAYLEACSFMAEYTKMG